MLEHDSVVQKDGQTKYVVGCIEFLDLSATCFVFGVFVICVLLADDIGGAGHHIDPTNSEHDVREDCGVTSGEKTAIFGLARVLITLA